nr:MAG TPA: hypothetical protein [Caudoviricetes sp.]
MECRYSNIQRDGLDRYWGLSVFSTLRSMVLIENT